VKERNIGEISIDKINNLAESDAVKQIAYGSAQYHCQRNFGEDVIVLGFDEISDYEYERRRRQDGISPGWTDSGSHGASAIENEMEIQEISQDRDCLALMHLGNNKRF
jgi:hypothetical protein